MSLADSRARQEGSSGAAPQRGRGALHHRGRDKTPGGRRPPRGYLHRTPGQDRGRRQGDHLPPLEWQGGTLRRRHARHRAPDAELPGTSMRDDLIALLEPLRQRGLASRLGAPAQRLRPDQVQPQDLGRLPGDRHRTAAPDHLRGPAPRTAGRRTPRRRGHRGHERPLRRPHAGTRRHAPGRRTPRGPGRTDRRHGTRGTASRQALVHPLVHPLGRCAECARFVTEAALRPVFGTPNTELFVLVPVRPSPDGEIDADHPLGS